MHVDEQDQDGVGDYISEEFKRDNYSDDGIKWDIGCLFESCAEHDCELVRVKWK